MPHRIACFILCLGLSAACGSSNTSTVDAGPPPTCVGGSASGMNCTDGILNGAETDIDCGGPECAPCTDGQACGRPRDCTSAICSAQACQTPATTCTNGSMDGSETDIDCGGTSCVRCGLAQHCTTSRDCTSYSCVDGTCEAALCVNSVVMSWSAPLMNADDTCLSDLGGYTVKYGTSAGVYAQMVDFPLDDPRLRCVPNGTSTNCGPEVDCYAYIYNVPEGPLFVAVSAYDTATPTRNDSENSMEISTMKACDGC